MNKKIISLILAILLTITVCSCGNKTEKSQVTGQEVNKVEETKKESQEEKLTKPSEKEDGIRQELKDFLTSYEVCMDEYVEFMQSYKPGDISLLSKYTEMLQKYADFAQKAQAWEDKDLNNEEVLYYTEVLGRVSQKLLKVSLGQ